MAGTSTTNGARVPAGAALAYNIAPISVIILPIKIPIFTFSNTKLGLVIFNSCVQTSANEDTSAIFT
jgi:hypothetical protein